MNIRAGIAADAALAASLHASEIGEGFLPSLGRPFLERLYRRIVKDPGAFLLVAEDDGPAVGFVAGTDDVRALYRSFLLHDGVPATLLALPRVVRAWRKVLETLRYPAGEAELPSAELLAIAVAAGQRGKGVGSQLVEALTDEFDRRSVPAVRVVVGAANDAAIALYRRGGFRPVARLEVHRGTPSQVLVRP